MKMFGSLTGIPKYRINLDEPDSNNLWTTIKQNLSMWASNQPPSRLASNKKMAFFWPYLMMRMPSIPALEDNDAH